MNPEKELSIGAFLAVTGGLGTIFSVLFGAMDLARPWSFLAGFVFGLLAGLGAALSISGLLKRRSLQKRE